MKRLLALFCSRRRIRRPVAALAATAALCGGAVVLSPPFQATATQITQYSETFSYTGSDQQFNVPFGVTNLQITADGARAARPDLATRTRRLGSVRR
jgi:hypothetical protein